MDPVALAKKFYINEVKDSMIYHYLGEIEKNEDIRKKLLGLSNIEKHHAEFWKKFIERRGGKVPEVKLGLFRKFSLRLMRALFGSVFIVSLFEATETSTISVYYEFYANQEMDGEEKRHLGNIILDEIEHERIFDREKKILHAENIRDLVLGMNDGLVELLGAVTGLSAVYVNNPLLVGLSGLIVGVAGALSMGIGAYVSVRSQRQVNEGTRRRLSIVFALSKERAKEEVRERLKEMGLANEVADEAADYIVKNGKPENIIPEEDINEGRAAIYTGLAYILGVFFPVVPYFFAPNSYIALPFSIFFAGLMLAIVSTIISVMSGISIKKKVMEMIILGLGAAALSYLFGSLINYLFGGIF
jgi:VIT1/CCC1 family predicted Fe2+/Mn2+ transporter